MIPHTQTPQELENLIDNVWLMSQKQPLTKHQLRIAFESAFSVGHDYGICECYPIDDNEPSKIEDSIVLTKREHNSLLDDSNLLACLLVCGVEKSEAFASAHDIYKKDKEQIEQNRRDIIAVS